MKRRHLLAAPALFWPASGGTLWPASGGMLWPAAALAQQRRQAPPAEPPTPRVIPWHGVNLVQAEQAPLGGADARRSMRLLAALGADSVALTPYLWQPAAGSADVVRGSDTPDEALLPGIRQARELGLKVLVKPHLWVNTARPGEARMADDAGWRRWFAAYTTALVAMARGAQEAGAEALSIGTAIRAATLRPEWREVIVAVRAVFRGRLLYVAADIEDAEAFPHWALLDAVGLRLYAPLGADDRGAEWLPVMNRETERLDRLEQRARKKIWVAELGIRSAAGAAANPSLSAEDRASTVDQRVQAEALARWLRRLDRPSVEAVLLWRWFTDPARGGSTDTDYTPQGKLAEGVLLHAWLAR